MLQKQSVTIRQSDFENAIRDLCSLGIIESSKNQKEDEYRIRVAILQLWLKENVPLNTTYKEEL